MSINLIANPSLLAAALQIAGTGSVSLCPYRSGVMICVTHSMGTFVAFDAGFVKDELSISKLSENVAEDLKRAAPPGCAREVVVTVATDAHCSGSLDVINRCGGVEATLSWVTVTPSRSSVRVGTWLPAALADLDGVSAAPVSVPARALSLVSEIGETLTASPCIQAGNNNKPLALFAFPSREGPSKLASAAFVFRDCKSSVDYSVVQDTKEFFNRAARDLGAAAATPVPVPVADCVADQATEPRCESVVDAPPFAPLESYN